MSLFQAFMREFDDDPLFRSMRQMNPLMGSLMGPDPFSMMNPFDGGLGAHSALTGAGSRSSSLMPFGMQSMPNINSLLSGAEAGSGQVFCASSFVSMSNGPDGRPHVYQQTASTKTGPGGIKETRNTVQDSRTGVKKMAIGHHIGERAHIIEKEQNVRQNTFEERQDFINLDEEEADDFNREFVAKASRGHHGGHGREQLRLPYDRQQQQQLRALPAPPVPQSSTTISSSTNDDDNATTNSSNNSTTTATTTTPSSRRLIRNISKVNARRQLRTPSSSPLVLTSQNPSTSSTSLHPHPYNTSISRRNRHKKSQQINPSTQQNH